MAVRGRWLAAAPLVGFVCALVVVGAGARASEPGESPVVEVERWLVAQGEPLRRVTILVDTRLADPEAVAAAMYPRALQRPAVGAQFATFGRWDAGDVPVPVQYDATFDPPGISGRPEMLAAINTWNSVSDQSFRFTDGGMTTDLTPICDDNQGDGGNTVRFSALLPDGVLGETCAFYGLESFPDMERIVEFDMHLDTATTEWSVSSQVPEGTYDLRSVMLHELGHALGLDHAANGTVMQPYLGDGEQQRTPTADDIAGIRELYGTAPTPSPPTETPTDTPTPTPPIVTVTPSPAPHPYRVSMGAVSRD